ncbi:hypothetical protein AC579_5226 [Pseudocercospora musae]|uniref:Major facilitator superfamily (MFS) profile domain-containing protein n=1 Tax=Pseudocercospora musae TaxID=113226 RepID=A0A139IPK5_9PEZI|nr:hypothetical protein AC579_5226 [Pseudocercospora musae]
MEDKTTHDEEIASFEPTQVDETTFDRGIAAWSHVAGCFCLYCNSWGILNTFAVFETYYSNAGAALVDNAAPSAIAWIGSTQSLLITLVSAIAGPVYDLGHLRLLLVAGTLLVGLGQLGPSFCHAYWQVFLTQGIAIGCGGGLLFLPAVALLPQYFKSKLGLAFGIATAGSSAGATIYPIVLRQLLDKVGFVWAVRAMAFIVLGTLLVPNMVLRDRTKPRQIRAVLNLESLKDRAYVLFIILGFVPFAGFFSVYIWLSLFSLRFTDDQMAFYVVTIFNAASCFGRILPNMVADYVGPFNVITIGSLAAGILVLNMSAIKSLAGLIVMTVLLGITGGVYIGTTPLCFNALTDDKRLLGTRMGMGYAVLGFGVLVGGPGAGAMLGAAEPLHWSGVWILSGVMCLFGAFGYAVVRASKYGMPVVQKV